MSLIDENTEMTAAELGAVIGVSRERIGQLAKEGIAVREGKGRFRAWVSIQNYLRKLQAPKSDPAFDRLTEARVRAINQRIDVLEERLIDRIDVEEVLTDMMATLRECFAGIGEGISDPEAVRRAEQFVERIFADMEKEFAARMVRLEAWGQSLTAMQSAEQRKARCLPPPANLGERFNRARLPS